MVSFFRGPRSDDDDFAAGGYPGTRAPVNFSTTSPTSRTSGPTRMPAASTIPERGCAALLAPVRRTRSPPFIDVLLVLPSVRALAQHEGDTAYHTQPRHVPLLQPIDSGSRYSPAPMR